MERSLLRGTKKTVIYVIIMMTLITVVSTSAVGIGGYGGAYLREPVGATAFALGGAQSASPQYLCAWWNPAALMTVKKKSLALGTGYRPLGRTEGYLSFEFPLPPRAAIGVSTLYRGIPLIKGLVDEQEYPLEDCAYATYAFRMGLSYLIKRNFTAGLNCSFYVQELPTGYESGNVIYSSATAIGFDLGLRYVVTKKYALGFVMKNLLSTFNWEFTGDFSPLFQDTLPATVTLGHEFKGSFMERPLIWTCDIVGYLFNAKFRSLPHGHVVINNGVEWQKWELFYVRAGVRDVEFNRDLFKNSRRYKNHLTMAITLGCTIDLSKALKGKDMRFNYGISTDKVGAGLDQQLDFVTTF